MTSKPETHWSLDKRFPLAVIVTIGLQTAGAVWWASRVDVNVGNNTSAVMKMWGRESRLTRLETNQLHILKAIESLRKEVRESFKK